MVIFASIFYLNFQEKTMQWGVNAITCYINACRSLIDVETRHLIARLFILLSMDDASSTLAQVFEKLSATTETRCKPA